MSLEKKRREIAFQTRVDAAEIALQRKFSFRQRESIKGESLPQPTLHHSNGEEILRNFPMSFTKGLPHNSRTGLLIEEASFDNFVKGIESGSKADLKQTPLGPAASTQEPRALSTPASWRSELARNLLYTKKQEDPAGDITRGWESSAAGLAFDLQGPDAQAVTMPPAPMLGSQELIAEMAEVYLQAALRDLPFSRYNRVVEGPRLIDSAIQALNGLSFLGMGSRRFVDARYNLTPLNRQNLFRGVFRGDTIGPYISQFLLIGNSGINGRDKEQGVDEGLITFGALRIDQRVRKASEVNYMVNWEEFIDVQNGADFRAQELYDNPPTRRFITTPRDLATYVHYDALYEAYLNACLILLSAGAAFDPGIPFQRSDSRDHQQGFALYGGPHVLTLVTEVATRALKAVRYQKFNVHRRCRPEALAARLDRLTELRPFVDEEAFQHFTEMDRALEEAGVFDILMKKSPGSGKLLPMAFAEGSPMHPSYGAGHAAVAGACTTVLKAWFDHMAYFDFGREDGAWEVNFNKQIPTTPIGFQGTGSGQRLETVAVLEGLTVEGELNKVAANVSIGRNWAGVHFYSDYVQSMLLGEEVAIALLQEQSLTYLPGDGLSMKLPKFDGSTVNIAKGRVLPVPTSC